VRTASARAGDAPRDAGGRANARATDAARANMLWRRVASETMTFHER
jgi:hypothetical protein